MRIAVFRKAHFNAAHRLYIKDWSDEKNREVFGVCSNPYYHGHNYDLEVKVVGETDPLTGMPENGSIARECIEYKKIFPADVIGLLRTIYLTNYHMGAVASIIAIRIGERPFAQHKGGNGCNPSE